MTSEGLGEMFEGDSADTCTGKFPLTLMGARAEGPACADLGGRTSIGVRENFFHPVVCTKSGLIGEYVSFKTFRGLH